MKNSKILLTTVLRSSIINDIHGEIFLVDINNLKTERIFKWDNTNIDLKGRGSGRGLRGISFYKNKTYIASVNSILVFNKKLNFIREIKNKNINGIHEIDIFDDKLYITSTMIDSIIIYDLKNERFITGIHIPSGIIYDPNNFNTFKYKDSIHLNNVFNKNGKIYFSCLKNNKLRFIENNKIYNYCEIPAGTHNVKILDNDNILFNYTKKNEIVIINKNNKRLKKYIINNSDIDYFIDIDNEKIARPNFGRGLTFNDKFIYGGSSPATISIYNWDNKRPIKKINIHNNIRYAIHGLEFFPY